MTQDALYCVHYNSTGHSVICNGSAVVEHHYLSEQTGTKASSQHSVPQNECWGLLGGLEKSGSPHFMIKEENKYQVNYYPISLIAIKMPKVNKYTNTMKKPFEKNANNVL